MLLATMIDDREPEWVQRLTFGNAPVSVVRLDAGDLLAATDDGEMIVVERKTSDDLLNTIRADRFLTQMQGLTQQTRWAYLIITGTLQCGMDGKVITDRGATGWSWAAIQGALLSAQELGVFVAYASGDTEYEPTVLRLANRKREASFVIPPAKAGTLLDAGEQIIASLPGIGPEKARILLEYAGGPAWALAYLTDQGLYSGKIPGVGHVTKQNVRKALGLEDWAELAVISTEAAQLVIQEGSYVQAGK